MVWYSLWCHYHPDWPESGSRSILPDFHVQTGNQVIFSQHFPALKMVVDVCSPYPYQNWESLAWRGICSIGGFAWSLDDAQIIPNPCWWFALFILFFVTIFSMIALWADILGIHLKPPDSNSETQLVGVNHVAQIKLRPPPAAIGCLTACRRCDMPKGACIQRLPWETDMATFDVQTLHTHTRVVHRYTDTQIHR